MQRINLDASIMALKTADIKRNLFIKIFKQELIRELHYIWDVANNRATARDNFTKKLIGLLQKGASSVPVIGSALEYLLTSADFAGDHKRDQAISSAARILDEIDLVRLEILTEIVAREALWRYESFIVDSLCDSPEEGVIPFAKVGVARILEKVIRSHSGDAQNKQIIMSESQFLSGLIEGRSGSFIEGWSNHTLKLKKQKKGFFKTTNAEIDAEDVYARPAFRHINFTNGILQNEFYVRSKARHHESSLLAKLKQIYHGETDSLFDFGYTKFRKSQPHEPKAGYIIMPLSVIKNRYDYEVQSKKIFSQSYLDDLKQATISRIQIDINTFKSYLEWHSRHPKNNILDFARKKLGLAGIKMVSCHGDFSLMKLAKKDLSYMDLSGSVLSGDLSETLFNHSYLIGTRFVQVTSAYRSQFHHTYAPMLTATGVNFTAADFTHANLTYAILNEANLSDCKTFGTIWTHSQLSNIKNNSFLQQEQKAHIAIVEKELKKQKAAIKILNEEMFNQYTMLRNLQTEYKEILETQTDAKPDIDLLKKMHHLIQREEAHTAFEIYCRNEISHLNKKLEQSIKHEEIDKLLYDLKTTKALLEKQNLERHQYNSSELLSRLDSLNNQNQQMKITVSDFQKRLMAALKENHTVLDRRIDTLKDDIRKIQQILSYRLDQVENRVENLEEWAKEAQTNLKQLKSAQNNNVSVQNQITVLEQKLTLLIKQQQKQESLTDKLVLLQARLNQVSEGKPNQPLQELLIKQKFDIEKLMEDPLINLIKNNLTALQNEFSESKNTDKTKKNQDQQLLENLLIDFDSQVKMEQEKIKHLIHPTLLIKEEDVERGKKIAESNLIKLYTGTWHAMDVVIKTSQENFSESDTACLLREIHIISRLHHLNIITFYGAYLEDNRPFLVMEKAEKGSLYQCLEEKPFSSSQQKQIILDIAQGLKYLHSQGILHRQLQSKNVLLTQDGRAKLMGFGLSKIRTASLVSAKINPQNQADQLRWCAPEFINDFHSYRRPSDIYSFGVIMWEIVTGKKPFADCNEKEILKRLETGKTENIPQTVPSVYRDLIERCWKSDPLERPTLKTIIEIVENYHYENKQQHISSEHFESLSMIVFSSENSKNFSDAYQNYIASSNEEHTRARTNLASFFLSKEKGSPQDKIKAYELLLESAHEGHPRAIMNLGQMLEHGDGISKNIEAAITWYEKAANLGVKDAPEKIEHAKHKLQQVKPII